MDKLFSSYKEFKGEDDDGIFGSDWKVHDNIASGNDFNSRLDLIRSGLGMDDSIESSSQGGEEEDDEEEDEEDEEEEEEESLGPKRRPSDLPRITSQEDFDVEVMQIPEEDAREKLDKLAEDPGRRRDPVLRYFPEPSDLPDGIHPSEKEYQSKAVSRMDRCPSIESFFRLKKVIDVHFYLHPGGRMVSRDCRLDATMYQLKNAISQFVQVPADHLDLRRKRNLVADNRTLMELGAGPRTKMKFTVEINKRIPGNYKLKMPKDKEVYAPREEQRTVSVGKGKTVQVTIIYPLEPKPKLGGYQDSRTGQKYLHASSSTVTIDVDQWEQSDKHKAVQAFNEKQAFTQTRQDFAQQME